MTCRHLNGPKCVYQCKFEDDEKDEKDDDDGDDDDYGDNDDDDNDDIYNDIGYLFLAGFIQLLQNLYTLLFIFRFSNSHRYNLLKISDFCLQFSNRVLAVL